MSLSWKITCKIEEFNEENTVENNDEDIDDIKPDLDNNLDKSDEESDDSATQGNLLMGIDNKTVIQGVSWQSEQSNLALLGIKT